MPERKEHLTKDTCPKGHDAVQERGSWARGPSGHWIETLTCRQCGTRWQRYGLPIEQERLNERYPVLPDATLQARLF